MRKGSFDHDHHGSLYTHHVEERFIWSLPPRVSLHPPCGGKVHLVITTTGLFTPTMWRKGSFGPYHHGSLYTHHVEERFIWSLPPRVSLHPPCGGKVHLVITTMGLFTPTMWTKGSFGHYHHGSLYTHHVEERFIWSLPPRVSLRPPCGRKVRLVINIMGLSTPTMRRKGSFGH